jgi:hypothetical protein
MPMSGVKDKTGRVTLRSVSPMGPGLLWDEKLPGFGVRCRDSGRRYYVLKYRFGALR